MVVNKEKDTLHYYAEVAHLYKYDRYKQLFGSQYFYLERKYKCISLNISNGNVSREISFFFILEKSLCSPTIKYGGGIIKRCNILSPHTP